MVKKKKKPHKTDFSVLLNGLSIDITLESHVALPSIGQQ